MATSPEVTMMLGSLGLGAGDGLLPRFYPRMVKRRDPANPTEFIEEAADWVEITILNDEKAVVARRATDEDKAMFPDHYRAYKEGGGQIVGIPLQALGIPAEVIQHFARHNIITVQALASITEAGMSRIGAGLLPMRDRAKVFLDEARTRAREDKATAELESTRNELAVVKTQLADLMELVRGLRPTIPDGETKPVEGDGSGPPAGNKSRRAA